MADQFIAYDPAAPAGQRLAPEVRTEIAVVAPAAVLNGSITTAKLADDAVTSAKIAPGAVENGDIATNAIDSPQIKAGAVTTSKLPDGAVTPVKTGVGVVTSVDSASVSVATRIQYLSAAQYSALGTPDPNTLYFIS